MFLTDIPDRISIPFANSAGGAYIRPVPVPSQIGVQPGAASFTDGFTPDTFTPLSGGGAYVNGDDMNGILNHVTKWTRWVAAGAAVPFNAAFATAIGGYPKLARLPSTLTSGREWLSEVDGNLTDPDGTSPVGWVPVGPVASTLLQAQQGTDTTSFITPSVLAELFGDIDSVSFSIPGPEGLIVKFGKQAINSGGAPHTVPLVFPTAFPANILSIVGNSDLGPNGNWSAMTVMFPGFTRTGGLISCDTANHGQGVPNMNVYWIAIGN